MSSSALTLTTTSTSTTESLASCKRRRHTIRKSTRPLTDVPKSKSSSSLFTPATVPYVGSVNATSTFLLSKSSHKHSKSSPTLSSSHSTSTPAAYHIPPYSHKYTCSRSRRASFFNPDSTSCASRFTSNSTSNSMRSDSEDEDGIIHTSWPEPPTRSTGLARMSGIRRSVSPPPSYSGSGPSSSSGVSSSSYASTSAKTLNNSYIHTASHHTFEVNNTKTTKTTSFRTRVFEFATGKTIVSRSREKLISTKPGERGAGETETEVDEP
ncbi:hypothetical protein K435DRAFT_880781, partial [Dendrothele bispora CBS 962.96]